MSKTITLILRYHTTRRGYAGGTVVGIIAEQGWVAYGIDQSGCAKQSVVLNLVGATEGI